MLLSIQQQYILEIARKLGYIQCRQLHTLLRRRFQPQGREISEAGMNAMLRQLRAGCQDIRLDDLGIWVTDAQPNPRRSEAVDVMLELSGDAPVEFHLGPSKPLLLRLSWAAPKFGCLPLRIFPPAHRTPWNATVWSGSCGSRKMAPCRRVLRYRPSTSLPPAWRTAHIGFMAQKSHEIKIILRRTLLCPGRKSNRTNRIRPCSPAP